MISISYDANKSNAQSVSKNDKRNFRTQKWRKLELKVFVKHVTDKALYETDKALYFGLRYSISLENFLLKNLRDYE